MIWHEIAYLLGSVTFFCEIYYLNKFYLSHGLSWSFRNWIYNYGLPVQSVLITTKICKFESHSWQGVLHTTLCDKVYQWRTRDLCFSLSTAVSSTNKADRHDITEIWLKVALNIISLILVQFSHFSTHVRNNW